MLGPSEPQFYPKQIAFNVIPFANNWMDDGYTDEEHKMRNETHKILDPDIKLTVTCVRVPVFVGHSEAVHLEFEHAIDEDEAREILREAPGINVIDKRDRTGYITPKEAQGEFPVYVSRIRKDPRLVENGLALSGLCPTTPAQRRAALNAVQIAELAHELRA